MNDSKLIPLSPGDPLIEQIRGHLMTKGRDIAITIDNFVYVMDNDPMFSRVQYNELANSAEIHSTRNGIVKIDKWSDAEEAHCRNYLEHIYGLYSREKFSDALRILFSKRAYNPIKSIIDNLEWDGEPRCAEFLTKWAQCGSSEYIHEVSRLIFAGGINRLYNPGCKFDDVPILIGTKQGEGKSSLIRWLAINDSFYGECNYMEGQQAIEQLSGKWIIEISELLAMTKQKEQEAVKAYITRTVDQYRKPYDRNVVELPRRVIFIGTSNNANPLVDKTGNRRFYPAKVGCTGFDLFDRETEIREYILQCWAEAKAKLNTDAMKPFLRRDLAEAVSAKQEDAMQDDYRFGMIQDYLTTKNIGELACVIELKRQGLNLGNDNILPPSMQEVKDISLMMNKMPGWEQLEGKRNIPGYGPQKAWMKIGEDVSQVQEDEEEYNWDIPF